MSFRDWQIESTGPLAAETAVSQKLATKNIDKVCKKEATVEYDFYPSDWAEDEPNSDDSEDRLNRIEWPTLQALRDMLGIALKGSSRPTYQQALALGKVIGPEIFDSEKTLLGENQERLLVKEYKQRAEAKSVSDGRQVNPIELVNEDINNLSQLLNKTEEESLIKRRISILRNVRSDLQLRNYTENQLIIRDTFKVQRNLPGPVTEGDTYRDFELAKGRGLRLRLIHPDPPEHSIGADLIYEQYWDAKQMARIVMVQYKIWNGKVLYLSQSPNLDAQLDKLDSVFCKQGYCDVFVDSKRKNAFRLPYCSAFLKPTDKLQDKDSRFISNGLYLPICVARRQLEDTGYGNRKLERKKIRSESLSHKVFEEVFNINMLGSKWLTYEEIEKLYKQHKILDKSDRIRLHVQEFNLAL